MEFRAWDADFPMNESAKSAEIKNHAICVSTDTVTVFVGDGFIRPEVRTFVNSGQVTSINAERGNLGTDKSVPYKNRYSVR